MVWTRVSISLGGTYLVSSSSFRIFDDESFLGSGVDVNADADSNVNNNNVGFISGDAGDDANDNDSKASTIIEDSLLRTVHLYSSSNSQCWISKHQAAAATTTDDDDDDDDDYDTLYISSLSYSLFS